MASASRRKLGPPPPPPPPPPPSSAKSLTNHRKHHHHSSSSHFRPGVVVIVGVLVITFSIIFLVLLYARHCKRTTRNDAPSVPTARRNSGVDRSIVKSLPLFSFASLRGQREGLECAVCLGKFDVDEHLRLLPKCNHVFHVDCVDTWLDAHSTCPLCRNQVDPEDVLIVPDFVDIAKVDGHHCKPEEVRDEQGLPGANSTGRHSSAGERSSNSPQMLAQKPPPRTRKSAHDGTPRKDLLLLTEKESDAMERRFGHGVVFSGGTREGNLGRPERWSDVGPSDLLLSRAADTIVGGGWTTSRSTTRSNISVAAVNPRSQSDITWMNRGEVGSGRRRRGRSGAGSTDVVAPPTGPTAWAREMTDLPTSHRLAVSTRT